MSISITKIKILIGTLLLARFVMAPSEGAPAGIEWPEKYFNPKPLSGDVILPLPCGGAMAFRKVHTEAVGPLGDQRVQIGGGEEEWAFAEHVRTAHVAGAFTESSRSRYLLFGKYEVSELQYQALLDPECPEPEMKKRLPGTWINWHDAVEFSHRYSIWLREVAAEFAPCQGSESPCIPSEDGELAFIRLPTEEEWEYGARGGAQVSASDFRERTFPMPKGIGSYAWFAGSQSANGKPQLIGAKEPNPLGLHDVLGNVAEIVLEPFRLNHLDRLHGQPGAFVVRGGDYLTPGQDIRTSLRLEVPFYDQAGPVRNKTTGFRVIATVPVITSAERLRMIQRAWGQLGSLKGPRDTPYPKTAQESKPAPTIDPRPLEDPIEELSAIAQASVDPNMQKRLLMLRSAMRSNIEMLNQQRNKAAREALRLGGVLCQKLRDENAAIEAFRKTLDACTEGFGAGYPRCRRYREKLKTDTTIIQYNLGVYADAVLATAQTYSEAVLDEQLQLLMTEISRKQFTALGPFIERFHVQVTDYGRNWRVQREPWNKECGSIP